MNKLADKIEAAKGPSRELDAEIAPLQGLRSVDEGHPLGRCCYDRNHRLVMLPAYTASLDTAMALVPENWKLRQMNFSAPCADDRKWHLNLHGGREGEDRFVGRGATPALAICAAALRAGNTKNRGFSMPQDEPDGRCPACGEDEMDGARCYYCGHHEYDCEMPDCERCNPALRAGDTDAG